MKGWLRRKKEDHGMFEDPYKTVRRTILVPFVIIPCHQDDPLAHQQKLFCAASSQEKA